MPNDAADRTSPPDEIDDGAVRFVVSGPALDVAALADFAAAANRVSAAGLSASRTLVDLRNVVYADALGMEALLDFVRRRPGECKLVGVRSELADWLTRVQLASILPWEPLGQ
jgi:anti-anti-sigma regulatory factor